MGLIAIAGGGAAGVFAAIACAEGNPRHKVIVLEKSRQFLSKVRISGGGRCNVTHACYEPRRLSEYYPRGGQALIGPFHVFQPRDTCDWFDRHGVKLKTEPDGRIFPESDSSASIVDCLLARALRAGVELRSGCGVEKIVRRAEGGFEISLSTGDTLGCDRLMLATGGCRAPAAGQLAVSLGHALIEPVPSLFAFQLSDPSLTRLAGISVPHVEVSVPQHRLHEQGAVLITHGGISGPAVLRVSAWGARELHAVGYRFPTLLNWIPNRSPEQLLKELTALKTSKGARLLRNAPLTPLPARLWESLLERSGISENLRWADLSKTALQNLLRQLQSCELAVNGKSLNRDEFVTCGGVPLREVSFKTMESKLCPGLFFGGELLDIDGLTGGFNFQAAWTTGWIAGKAMAAEVPR